MTHRRIARGQEVDQGMTNDAPQPGFWRSWITPFRPLPTGALADGLCAVRVGVVNLFLCAQASGYLAIDSGSSPRSLQRALHRLGILPSQVTAVLLTHGDVDHTGGLRALPEATIYLGAGDVPLVEGRVRRSLGILKVPRLPRAYHVLQDGAELEIGGLRVQALATPGHTPGATCYLVAGKWLFTGDLLSLRAGRATPLSRLFSMDWERQRASVHRLAGLPLADVEWLCTAHSGAAQDVRRALAGLLDGEP